MKSPSRSRSRSCGRVAAASGSERGSRSGSGAAGAAAATAAGAAAAAAAAASIPQSGPATIVDTAFSGSPVGDNVGSGIFVLFDQHHSTGQSYRYHARILDIVALRPEPEQPSDSLLAASLKANEEKTEKRKESCLVTQKPKDGFSHYLDKVDPDGRIWKKLLDIMQMEPRHVRNHAWQALLREQHHDDKIVEFLQMCTRTGFLDVGSS